MPGPGMVIADVECKSESKPLFFKSILNRLRSAESSDDSTRNTHSQRVSAAAPEPEPKSTPARVQLQPSHLECNSRSNALKLKNTDSGQRTVQYSRSSKQYQLPDGAAATTPNWPNAFQPSDSYPPPVGAVWHPFFHHEHQLSSVPTNGFNDDPVRKLRPSPLLPANFAYHPISSLDEEYYQAVAKAAAAAAATSQKPYSFGDKIIANKGHNANDTATKDQVLPVQNNQTRQEWQPQPPPPPPLTKIILRPQASATAGKQGIAISAPISTAYVKRGDYVEIEYVPLSKADVGEGGVAISRPELIIHFIDRRK